MPNIGFTVPCRAFKPTTSCLPLSLGPYISFGNGIIHVVSPVPSLQRSGEAAIKIDRWLGWWGIGAEPVGPANEPIDFTRHLGYLMGPAKLTKRPNNVQDVKKVDFGVL